MSDLTDFQIAVMRRLAIFEQAVDRLIESHVSLAAEVRYRNELLDGIISDVRASIRHERDESEWWKSGDDPPDFDE